MDRRKWMVLGGLALAAFVVLGWWGQSQAASRGSVEAALTGQYQRSFYAALDNIQNAHVLLGKAMVAGDKVQLADLFSQVRAQAFAAQENLTQMPVPATVEPRAAKFLTQVGDFAGGMVRRTAGGQVLDQGQRNTLADLYRQSGQLNQQLRAAEGQSGSGRLYLADAPAGAKGRVGGRGPAASDLSGINTRMEKYPGPVYDGPFAENVVRGRITLPGPPTAMNQLGTIAVNFLDRVPGVRYQGRYTGSVKGDLPAYRVQVSPVNSRADAPTTMDIAANGGKVVWYLDPRAVSRGGWIVARARDKALSFLGERGMGTFVSTFHRLAGNVAIFSLARVEGGVTDYARQVKVSVALDNGQVVGYEGRDYLANSRLRPANKVVLNAAQAGRLVKAGLAAGPGALVLIPDDRGGELYVYEFSGRQDGDSYLVYINAQNGKEERILRVAPAPGGGQVTL